MISIAQAIETAVAGTTPFTAERNAALAKVQWILQWEGGAVYAAVCSGCLRVGATTDISEAKVFTGLDNEVLKAAFFSAALKARFVPVLLGN